VGPPEPEGDGDAVPDRTFGLNIPIFTSIMSVPTVTNTTDSLMQLFTEPVLRGQGLCRASASRSGSHGGQVFHADACAYVLLSSIMAIGTSAGARLARRNPRFDLLLIGAGVFGLGSTLAAIAPTYWFFASALVIIGESLLALSARRLITCTSRASFRMTLPWTRHKR
jgi:hypothetical protein